MPNAQTFTIKPIRQLIDRYLNGGLWADAFAGIHGNSPAQITNDLNPVAKTTHNLDALEFVRLLDDDSLDGFLFDPPYSPRQVKECYDSIGLDTVADSTRMDFWTNIKTEAASKLKSGGIAICCGWNTMGFGHSRGFHMEEILLVAHGGMHNDTLVTVERRVNRLTDWIH